MVHLNLVRLLFAVTSFAGIDQNEVPPAKPLTDNRQENSTAAQLQEQSKREIQALATNEERSADKVHALRKERDEKNLEVLTAEQRAQFGALKGKVFDISQLVPQSPDPDRRND